MKQIRDLLKTIHKNKEINIKGLTTDLVETEINTW